jgi:cell division protein FtsQ
MRLLIDKKKKVVLYLVFFFLLSTISNKNLNVKKNYSMKIDNIDIKGLSDIKNLQILDKLDDYFYKNIFFLNKSEINKIISNYNIIEEYNVKKIYPTTLDINIKPTKIIAKISGDNQLVVGSNGKLIISNVRYETLPFIFGKFKKKEFLIFKKKVEQSKFKFKDLKSIFFYPSGRWDIVTLENVLIKLPKDELLRSLKLAYKVKSNDKFKDNKVIDLRVFNNLVVQ